MGLRHLEVIPRSPAAFSAIDIMKTLKRKRGTATMDAAAQMLPLPCSCTVKDAAELKITLCRHLQTEDCVVLDGANVERIDTAALQLLCAFVRDRQARGHRVQWQGGSAALQEAADLLALRGLLGLGEAPRESPPGAAP